MFGDDDAFDSYEWDEEKSDLTYEKNGIDFDFASRVFESEAGYVQKEDRREYAEPRYVVTGEVDEIVITVFWTPRRPARRIISAWPATEREKRRYRSAHRKTNR